MNDSWLGLSATRTAWTAEVENSAQRLVLLAVAKYADDRGCSFPSAETICSDTKLNRKTVFKALNDLKRLGCISVSKGANNRNNYSISSTKNGTTENGTTEFGTSQKRYDSSTKNGTTVVPNLVREEYQEEYQEKNKTRRFVIVQEIVDIYNNVCNGKLPSVKVLSDKRSKSIRKWIDFYQKQTKVTTAEAFKREVRKYFELVITSDFLLGKTGDRPWKADLDFLMNTEKTVKILEGGYGTKHEEPSIHKVKNPGPPPSKDDDGWKAQEAYFRRIGMFKGLAS